MAKCFLKMHKTLSQTKKLCSPTKEFSAIYFWTLIRIKKYNIINFLLFTNLRNLGDFWASVVHHLDFHVQNFVFTFCSPNDVHTKHYIILNHIFWDITDIIVTYLNDQQWTWNKINVLVQKKLKKAWTILQNRKRQKKSCDLFLFMNIILKNFEDINAFG